MTDHSARTGHSGDGDRGGDQVIKTDFQRYRLAQAAGILKGLFADIEALIAPGLNGLDLQTRALQYLAQRGARPALREYKGFQADISVSVNEIAAHGLPDARPFRPGDLVTVDCAILYEGWYGDMAWTFGVPPVSAAGRRLIRAAWQSCLRGCLALRPGVAVGTLGAVIISTCRRFGGRIVHEFCGHSIGRRLHEHPLIPYTARPGAGWLVQEGMVLNIEPVITLGEPAFALADNRLSYAMTDRQPTAQFELTCAVTDKGIDILSLPDMAVEDIFEYPPCLYRKI